MSHPDTTPKDDQQPPPQDPLQLIETLKERCITIDNENKEWEAEQQALIDDLKFKLCVKEGELQNTNWAADGLESQLKRLKQELRDKDGELEANLKTKQDELTEERIWRERCIEILTDSESELKTVKAELRKVVGQHEAVKETLNTTKGQLEEANIQRKSAVEELAEELAQAKTKGDEARADAKKWKDLCERAKATWETRSTADCDLHTMFATTLE
jgi:chromosome segregation ATPase